MTTFLDAANAAGLNVENKDTVMGKKSRKLVIVGDTARISGCVDLDNHFMATEPNANRWDYGLGFVKKGAEFALWIEVHPARTDQVSVMIRKARWLREKLNTIGFEDLLKLTNKAEDNDEAPLYRWLATDKINIPRRSTARAQLATAGLMFPEESIRVG